MWERVSDWVVGTLVAVFGCVGLIMGVGARDEEIFIFGFSLAGRRSISASPSLNFGRLRPVHTSAVIFAFGGNVLFGTSFYVVQRTCRARLFGGARWFVFWGYQFFIVMAALSYVLGFSSGQEYAEPEWHLDLWLTIVWVAYLVVFLGTLLKRKEPHIYVANWFYLAFILTIAVLHIGNNAACRCQLLLRQSYIVYSGVQDAMIQWWYGHNAVGFFLTAGFLGMMYYFIPKAANRPVYSYRLSIVHFWSLIFSISGPVRITCTTPRCPTGRRRWA
jgi:cytochrome c oxidase cbb3-type subunit 1